MYITILHTWIIIPGLVTLIIVVSGVSAYTISPDIPVFLNVRNTHAHILLFVYPG